MKNEFIALALLAAIFVASIFNANYVENKTQALTGEIDAAEAFYNQGDTQSASKHLDASLNAWHKWESYAHIMLRHSEVDLVTETYFDLLGQLESGETVPDAAFEQLKDRLENIAEMEKISSKAVF